MSQGRFAYFAEIAIYSPKQMRQRNTLDLPAWHQDTVKRLNLQQRSCRLNWDSVIGRLNSIPLWPSGLGMNLASTWLRSDLSCEVHSARGIKLKVAFWCPWSVRARGFTKGRSEQAVILVDRDLNAEQQQKSSYTLGPPPPTSGRPPEARVIQLLEDALRRLIS